MSKRVAFILEGRLVELGGRFYLNEGAAEEVDLTDELSIWENKKVKITIEVTE